MAIVLQLGVGCQEEVQRKAWLILFGNKYESKPLLSRSPEIDEEIHDKEAPGDVSCMSGKCSGRHERQHGECGEGQSKWGYNLSRVKCWVITTSWMVVFSVSYISKQNKWVSVVGCYSWHCLFVCLGHQVDSVYGWDGEWELVLLVLDLSWQAEERGKLLLQVFTPSFPFPDCGPLQSQGSNWLSLFPMMPRRILRENGLYNMIRQQWYFLNLKTGMEKRGPLQTMKTNQPYIYIILFEWVEEWL